MKYIQSSFPWFGTDHNGKQQVKGKVTQSSWALHRRLCESEEQLLEGKESARRLLELDGSSTENGDVG